MSQTLAEQIYATLNHTGCGCGGDESVTTQQLEAVYTAALASAVIAGDVQGADIAAAEKEMFLFCGCGGMTGVYEALNLAQELGEWRKSGDSRPTEEVATEIKAVWKQATDEKEAARKTEEAAREKIIRDFLRSAHVGISPDGRPYVDYRDEKVPVWWVWPRPTLRSWIRFWFLRKK
jgi:hypothetical protein